MTGSERTSAADRVPPLQAPDKASMRGGVKNMVAPHQQRPSGARHGSQWPGQAGTGAVVRRLR